MTAQSHRDVHGALWEHVGREANDLERLRSPVGVSRPTLLDRTEELLEMVDESWHG